MHNGRAPLRQDMREPGAVISAVTRPNDRADPALLISSPFRDFVGKATRPTDRSMSRKAAHATRPWPRCASPLLLPRRACTAGHYY